ncbi:MAG TPA: molecular chaperone HtpG [Chitinophagales bacterium]|nr:molecular chaperone HtpG [Chitinophagales bacterium]
METGQINVKTENIFPIIKKFLYSDHEIFLRELVANAVDATQKLKALAAAGEVKEELGDLAIEITIDEKEKTLTVSDRGIGMTGEEVKRYINQIAFSSAQEFVEKFRNETNLIGKFGLGFYSAFMVSDKVEIITKSYKPDAKAVKWSCDGSPEYSLDETKKKSRGTDVILFISDESKEFLEKDRIRSLLEKYCKFLPVPIRFDGRQINNTEPAWTKKPSELTSQNYRDFYKELYPFSDAPLFWIHLNVDYPFNLTGILYFPKLKGAYEFQKNKIQLYCRQVFVTDSVEGIVPEFLMHLHGVIDSPDIPLNVSRSYLQSDPNVKKISSYITKKVGEKLSELFRENRREFEEKWEHISVFVKYGMISDEKFFEKAKEFCLLQNTEKQFFTIDEYKDKIKALQTDRHDHIVALYTASAEAQHHFVQAAKDRGYDVLVMDSIIDNHFFSHLEAKLDKLSFKRVDADTVEHLIEKEEKKESVLSRREEEKLIALFKEQINDPKITVVVKALSPDDQPVTITRPEFTRRMRDMAAAGGYGRPDFMPEEYHLIVNANHPLISSILNEESKQKKEELVSQLYDLALLSQNMLKGSKLTDFVRRSVGMLSGESKGKGKIILEG